MAFSALARADVARLTPPNALPITRLDPRIRPDARFGGVSRAAKGADCKSAGLAFVGSSPTSPTILKSQTNRQKSGPQSGAIFMSRMLHDFRKQIQWLSLAPGSSMQHERDMERLKRRLRLSSSGRTGSGIVASGRLRHSGADTVNQSPWA